MLVLTLNFRNLFFVAERGEKTYKMSVGDGCTLWIPLSALQRSLSARGQTKRYLIEQVESKPQHDWKVVASWMGGSLYLARKIVGLRYRALSTLSCWPCLFERVGGKIPSIQDAHALLPGEETRRIRVQLHRPRTLPENQSISDHLTYDG